MDSIYRTLEPNEVEQAKRQEEIRTVYECNAYRLLPRSMRKNVERNPAIVYPECNVTFFPDPLFRKDGICVEIDGGYHMRRLRQDVYRDKVFEEHDITTIRIKNRDTLVNVAFWQRLVEGMEHMSSKTPSVDEYITELRQLIDLEIWSWTHFERENDLYDSA